MELIKLRARLDIQKFEEMESEGIPSNYKSLSSFGNNPSDTSNEGGRFFIQGSRMNGGEFDEGLDEDQPF